MEVNPPSVAEARGTQSVGVNRRMQFEMRNSPLAVLAVMATCGLGAALLVAPAPSAHAAGEPKAPAHAAGEPKAPAHAAGEPKAPAHAAGKPKAPARAAGKPKASLPWDWSGIIGTGQSLSVGARALHILSTTQPYNNLKLSTGDLAWPVDPSAPSLKMVPLVEPVGRLAPTYPSSWPTNIDGETFHTTMADELTVLVRKNFKRDFISVHSAVGEDGQGMVYIKKGAEIHGVKGHSYQAALTEATAITRLAKAVGKTYGVGAVVVTHGESDSGNHDYEAQLHQLWQDYNSDLRAITGQSQHIPMILTQQNAVADHSPSTLAQWKIGVDYPAEIVCSGPKYQYPYFTDGVHLTGEGYRQLGEKYAQVYYQRVILGRQWEPLEPTGAARRGWTITVHFHVPVAPLAWETTFSPPHPSVGEWKDGKGFEVSDTSGAKVRIKSVTIVGNSVVITCASDPGADALVGYAMVGEPGVSSAPHAGTYRWGLLRDSDPFVGAVTGRPQPNYALAFEMPAL